MKPEWKYLTGNLIVTVKAQNENDEPEYFDFACYVSPNLNAYDKMDNLLDIAQHAANLRELYRADIADIKQK